VGGHGVAAINHAQIVSGQKPAPETQG